LIKESNKILLNFRSKIVENQIEFQNPYESNSPIVSQQPPPQHARQPSNTQGNNSHNNIIQSKIPEKVELTTYDYNLSLKNKLSEKRISLQKHRRKFSGNDEPEIQSVTTENKERKPQGKIIRPARLSIYYILKSKLCKRFMTRQQEELYKVCEFSKKYLDERLDIVNYLKTLEKFDRFRLLFLNYTQNACLDFIKKPNIHDEEEMEYLDHNFGKSLKNKEEDIIQYYNHKIKSEDLSELTDIDTLLLFMINPAIKNKIELK
jgi:hypothetical protein